GAGSGSLPGIAGHVAAGRAGRPFALGRWARFAQRRRGATDVLLATVEEGARYEPSYVPSVRRRCAVGRVAVRGRVLVRRRRSRWRRFMFRPDGGRGGVRPGRSGGEGQGATRQV